LDGGVLFLYSADVGKSRADGKALPELVEFQRGTDGIHFHRAVVEVAGVTCQTQLGGSALDEVAESDALHAPADPVALRGG